MVTMKTQFVSNPVFISRGTNTKKFITIHETANLSKGANAQAHANLQSKGNSRNASWHWQVDSKEAIQSYGHSLRCWHAGSTKGNNESIGIEICINNDGNYHQAVENAAELVRWIMKLEGIHISNVVQHNYWSGKNCPTILRNGSRGINWTEFKTKLKGEAVKPVSRDYFMLDDKGIGVSALQKNLVKVGYKLDVDGIFGKVTEDAVKAFQRASNLSVDGIYGKASQMKLDAILANMNKPKPPIKPKPPVIEPKPEKEDDVVIADNKTNEPSVWAKEDIEEAVKLEITDGSRLHDNVTREEAIVLVMRGFELAKKRK